MYKPAKERRMQPSTHDKVLLAFTLAMDGFGWRRLKRYEIIPSGEPLRPDAYLFKYDKSGYHKRMVVEVKPPKCDTIELAKGIGQCALYTLLLCSKMNDYACLVAPERYNNADHVKMLEQMCDQVAPWLVVVLYDENLKFWYPKGIHFAPGSKSLAYVGSP